VASFCDACSDVCLVVRVVDSRVLQVRRCPYLADCDCCQCKRSMVAVRANPATSAPSHICETWRNVAQTCLNIKEMGPERSRINVCDPIVASF